MKKIFSTLQYSDLLLTVITVLISLTAFCYYYFHGQANLGYYDAVARLNTARKIIDSITPGVGQLGGIWLPFPQILSIPFIWNDFLWHTGIAGYFISGLCFVVGAVFLEKTTYLLTKSRRVALVIWFLFVSNINLLLLQTMAMSETFFLCFFILTMYYLLQWMKSHKLSHFLMTAFSGMILTLTRYEGDFILAGVFIAITIECFRIYWRHNKAKMEGMLLLFLTIAGFGIILWCIYSALFYKDPLFWLHAYTPSKAAILAWKKVATVEKLYGILTPTLFQSLTIYSSVVMWTIGLIPVMLGVLGMLSYCLQPNRKYFPLFIVTVVLFLFLVFGYYKHFIPHIEFPVVHLTGLGTRPWSVYADSNVRYGIILMPVILLFAGLAAAKNRFFFVVVSLFALEQLFFSVVSPQLFQYRFDKSWRYPQNLHTQWFREHYDGGLVLVAASRHEDFIFQSELPYRDFIYEGTRNYWNDSLDHPSTHARWVVFDTSVQGDSVTVGLTQKAGKDLDKNYQLVYLNGGFHIYKLKS